MRFEAVAEVSQVVTAKSRKDATNQALQAVRQPDLNRGTITKRIIHISD